MDNKEIALTFEKCAEILAIQGETRRRIMAYERAAETIGALERDVLLQFLIEAVVLSSFGGLIGISFGLAVSVLVTRLFHMPLVFNSSIIVLAFAFSAAVGIVFGFFPARQAARLDPIDALRHE